MKPDADGKVPHQRLAADRQSRIVGNGDYAERYPIWRFGREYDALTNWLVEQRSQRGALPSQVWITTLCSYWYQGVVHVCNRVRQQLGDARLVLLGNYPQLLPDHAASRCDSDIIVASPVDVAGHSSDFDLYADGRPPFAAVTLEPDVAIAEIKAAVEEGITSVAFFSDDVCVDDGGPLGEILRKTDHLHRHIKYHLICGLHPAKVSRGVADVLSNPHIEELHFEEADADSALDVEAYRRAIANLQAAGVRIPGRDLSGFVWIGRPNEDLDGIIQRMIQVLRLLGSFILKPFTPTPGGPECKQYAEYLARIERHEDWSPHLFPFAELNGITRTDYNDLYRLAAFLNDKVRGQSFDFLKGTLGMRFITESIRREVWNIEPNSLRVVD
ncbi:MAG: hypothetical protein HY000_23265 [Planctomycetes bacterium]|nr:hypothetical protein [Planctomycetota bacterium]